MRFSYAAKSTVRTRVILNTWPTVYVHTATYDSLFNHYTCTTLFDKGRIIVGEQYVAIYYNILHTCIIHRFAIHMLVTTVDILEKISFSIITKLFRYKIYQILCIYIVLEKN